MFFQPLKPRPNRSEVGQRSAQPAIADVVHSTLLSDGLDGLLGLTLGSDEDDVFAAADNACKEPFRYQEPL